MLFRRQVSVYPLVLRFKPMVVMGHTYDTDRSFLNGPVVAPMVSMDYRLTFEPPMMGMLCRVSVTTRTSLEVYSSHFST